MGFFYYSSVQVIILLVKIHRLGMIHVNILNEGNIYWNTILHSITVCPPNHFGPNCARCRQSCRSCDSITGVCTQCNGSFYGEYCQHVCTENCLNATCDQRTGSCNGSKDGFQGDSCNPEIVSSETIPGL